METIEIQGKSLDDLLDLIEKGEIILTRNNQPIARLTPLQHKTHAHQKRIAGLNKGTTIYVSEDFDDELPDEFWFKNS